MLNRLDVVARDITNSREINSAPDSAKPVD